MLNNTKHINKEEGTKFGDPSQDFTFSNDEKQKLNELSHSAHFIELLSPPNKVWQELQIKADDKKSQASRYFAIGGVAASIAISFLMLISYQNMSIQSELKELRLTNQLLEQELNSLQQNDEIASEMLKHVMNTEQQLEYTNDKHKILQLLQQRKFAIQAMIEMEQMEKKDDVIFL